MALIKVAVRCSVCLVLPQAKYVEEREKETEKFHGTFSLEDTIGGWIRLHLEYFNL